jgi:hypothetical protein
MGSLLFMFPIGAVVGAIVGATRNRTREGAILGFLLAFVGVVIVVFMEPKPVSGSPRPEYRHTGAMPSSLRPAK